MSTEEKKPQGVSTDERDSRFVWEKGQATVKPASEDAEKLADLSTMFGEDD